MARPPQQKIIMKLSEQPAKDAAPSSDAPEKNQSTAFDVVAASDRSSSATDQPKPAPRAHHYERLVSLFTRDRLICAAAIIVIAGGIKFLLTSRAPSALQTEAESASGQDNKRSAQSSTSASALTPSSETADVLGAAARPDRERASRAPSSVPATQPTSSPHDSQQTTSFNVGSVRVRQASRANQLPIGHDPNRFAQTTRFPFSPNYQPLRVRIYDSAQPALTSGELPSPVRPNAVMPNVSRTRIDSLLEPSRANRTAPVPTPIDLPVTGHRFQAVSTNTSSLAGAAQPIAGHGAVGAPNGSTRLLGHLLKIQIDDVARLSGVGLVVGLQGNGDGETQRATVQTLLQHVIRDQPTLQQHLRDLSQVAVVSVEADVPAEGVVWRSKLNCTVRSLLGSAITGGQLLPTALRSADGKETETLAVASGWVSPESGDAISTRVVAASNSMKTPHQLATASSRSNAQAGVIPSGAEASQTFLWKTFDSTPEPRVTLRLNKRDADLALTASAADDINTALRRKQFGHHVRVIAPGTLQVTFQPVKGRAGIGMIDDFMNLPISAQQSRPVLLIDRADRSVQVSGTMVVSPVVLTINDLTIQVGDPSRESHSLATAADLLTCLNRLQVPAQVSIDILKQLHSSGKLHGELIESGFNSQATVEMGTPLQPVVPPAPSPAIHVRDMQHVAVGGHSSLN